MAKKIIKEPTIRRYKATCPICGCEFEFDTTDASWSQRVVNNNEYYSRGIPSITRTVNVCKIACPCCQMWLENKQTEITDEQ